MTREGNTVTVTCTSTHLTSFAVLVDVGGARVCLYIHVLGKLACFCGLFFRIEMKIIIRLMMHPLHASRNMMCHHALEYIIC